MHEDTRRPPFEERLQPFDACFNFRDVGGYTTRDGRRLRWRQLYRADSLHRFTEKDLGRFGKLGISTVVDLRSDREISDFGRFEPEAGGPAWHHLPLIATVALTPEATPLPEGESRSEAAPGDRYFEFLGDATAATSVLSLLAASEGAAVFHCTSGKDRTGIIAAMLLDLLGVPDATIASDYALTQETRARYLAWVAEHEPDFAAYLARIPPDRRVVRGERILGFLERLRAAHGSVENLVRARGLAVPDLEALRERMLEPGPD